MGQHRQHRAKLAGMEGDLGDAFSESNVHPVNGLRVDRVPDQEERKRQKQDQPQQYERSCRGGHQHACQPPHWHTFPSRLMHSRGKKRQHNYKVGRLGPVNS